MYLSANILHKSRMANAAACTARKVVVGGGTGFIGQQLTPRLIDCAFVVRNVSRKPAPNNISWQQVKDCGLPAGTTAVVNLAGHNIMDFKYKWTPSFQHMIEASRVNTTYTLSCAINQDLNKPSVFVLVTGVGAYEPSQVTQYDEYSPISKTDFFSCLVDKWEGAAQVDPQVRLVIIRSGAVLGRTGGMIKNMYLPFSLGLGGPIGSGKQYLPWIHVKDLTRLIVYAIMNPNVSGVLNGVSPQIITNEEFTRAFAKALKRPAFIRSPEPLLNFLLNPERAMIMTKGQIVHPTRTLETGFQYEYNDIKEACRELAKG